MPDEDRPQEAEIDEVSARLNDALKSCRSVVANYKALLAADNSNVEPADASDSGEPGPAPDVTPTPEH